MFDIQTFSFSPLARLFHIIAMGSALSLSPFPSLNDQLSGPAQDIDGSNLVPFLNDSAIFLNSSALDAPLAQCSAAKFGSFSRFQSCQAAIVDFEFLRDNDQVTFANRAEVEPRGVGLPFRTLSSM